MAVSPLTLTLYPNAFGMGYVISESPKELINYGIARVRPLTKDKYVKRLLRFIKYYKPALIILRGYSKKDNRISKRVIKVIDAFEKEAENLGLPVHKYSRENIKEVFGQFGSHSKYEISKTICSWYPELKSRMPNLRKNTKAEHYQMGVFDAFALMLTHHYLI
ncbi:MAG: hypothetical protein ACK5M1_12590 [Xanthomarina gelatinilytica]|uniref:hypothetical protein n=1 Tax=Xanthomarina gelatinilytica TaxID=1137281 RepID=UPI003A8AB751